MAKLSTSICLGPNLELSFDELLLSNLSWLHTPLGKRPIATASLNTDLLVPELHCKINCGKLTAEGCCAIPSHQLQHVNVKPST
eukprot:654165-Amphidinium_carterae.1